VNDLPTQPLGPTPDELKLRYAVLERVAILFTVPDNLLRALARQLQPAFAAKGSTIIHQGDPGESMFIIQEGRCEVTVEESPGHAITIAFLGGGDFFGEMALVSEEARTATVRALEDCKLLVLDRKTLYNTLPPDSDAFIELSRLVDQRQATIQNLIQRAQMVAPEQAATTVAVYSPKGGAGRTTVAVNLAAALARQFTGEVLLVDMALPYNHAALMSNLVPTGSLAAASQVPPANFEETLLSAILHHPGGMMLLPGVLKPEDADLVTPELVGKAMAMLGNTFRYIIFDLGVAMSEAVLTVLDHSQRIVLIATPELSTLKDISDLMRIFTNVLNIVPGRVLITMNNKSGRPVVSREDVERTLKQDIACEFAFDGSKPDEAAVKGEILVLSDPKSAITRGTLQLAEQLVGLRSDNAKAKDRKLPFGFKVG
jgi:MinD-like ATPase involved in chromosome partitioning or flagellar assembly